MSVLYVFLDESGNLDFSRGGTEHYVLAAVTTTNPLVSSQELQRLKYIQLEKGVDTEYFHASEDLQTTRNEVILQKQPGSETPTVLSKTQAVPVEQVSPQTAGPVQPEQITPPGSSEQQPPTV